MQLHFRRKPERTAPRKADGSAPLEASISRYIWNHTKPQQLWILAIVALSMIPYFMSFNLPKDIVNGPIQGKGFETPGATQTFMRIAFDLPFTGEVVLFNGVELERLPMLWALSAVFLALVVINGLFKFYINTYKGKLGERLLRRIRFALVDKVMRFPPATFKRLKGAEIASMVKDEVEPLGGFTGDAFVAPALLGGQALTALVFIYVQNVTLGVITTVLVAVQAFIIPRMRRRLLVLGRERQITARQLAGRISDIVERIATIHAYDTTNYERADIASRLGRIFSIRYAIYRWKFLVKFINNFLASLTPFLFYSVGGYLALSGRLDIGQLVAVIGAYKDLPGPLKELIDWDQNRQDVEVKYQQVVSQFAVDGMIANTLHEVTSTSARGRLSPPLSAVNLGVVDDSGSVVLDAVNFALHPGETVALLGPVGSGSDTLPEVFARLVWPSHGRVQAGRLNLLDLPEAITGRAITYAGPESHLFSGPVFDNLVYGLKNAPQPVAEPVPDTSERQWQRHEAALSGNPDHDPDGRWIDLAGLGMTNHLDLMDEILVILDCVMLTSDIREMALRARISPDDHPQLSHKIVEMRGLLRADLERQNLTDLLVPFERDKYNSEATVLENLLFGNLRESMNDADRLRLNTMFRKKLQDRGLSDAFSRMGVEIARNIVSLFADLPPEHPFFRSMNLMSPEDIPAYQSLVQKLDTPGATPTPEDRDRLIRLSYDYVEPQHRFGLLDPDLQARIVAFRHELQQSIPADLRDLVEDYDPDRFMATGTLRDNIFFGRVSQRFRDGVEQVNETMERLLRELGIYQRFLCIGLTFDVGTNGGRLSVTQRQKLALARALLRPSDYYLFNRPLNALDARSQEAILTAGLAHLRKRNPDAAILCTIVNPDMARHFDRVAHFDAGVLAEPGAAETASQNNGITQAAMGA